MPAFIDQLPDCRVAERNALPQFANTSGRLLHTLSVERSFVIVPRRRLKGLQDDILGILEATALQTLVDERLHFGICDLNAHRQRFVIIITPPRNPISDL